MTIQTQSKTPAHQKAYALSRGRDAEDPPVESEPDIETPPMTNDEDDKE